MLVTDRRRVSGTDELLALAGEAARAGVDLIQVREKDLEGKALTSLVAAVLAAVRGSSTRVIVNGRADVAEVTGAWGVQLPEQGLPVGEVRRAFPHLVVGVSRHTLDGVQRAQEDGAHYVVLGPIFPTPGKESRALGLTALRSAAAQARIPVIAIGGIDARTAATVWAAGARGVAAIRPFVAGDLAKTVRALR